MGYASFPSNIVSFGDRPTQNERSQPGGKLLPPIAVASPPAGPPALLPEGRLPPGDLIFLSEWDCEVSNPGFYLASTIIMSRLNNLPLSPG